MPERINSSNWYRPNPISCWKQRDTGACIRVEPGHSITQVAYSIHSSARMLTLHPHLSRWYAGPRTESHLVHPFGLLYGLRSSYLTSWWWMSAPGDLSELMNQCPVVNVLIEATMVAENRNSIIKKFWVGTMYSSLMAYGITHCSSTYRVVHVRSSTAPVRCMGQTPAPRNSARSSETVRLELHVDPSRDNHYLW